MHILGRLCKTPQHPQPMGDSLIKQWVWVLLLRRNPNARAKPIVFIAANPSKAKWGQRSWSLNVQGLSSN